MRLFLTLILAVFSASELLLFAEPEWSDDQKQACMALLKEYPLAIEPAFKRQNEKDYWRKNLLDDKAIYFRRYTHADAASHGEFYQGSGWNPIYKAESTDADKSDVWFIIVGDRQSKSLSAYSLYVYINTSTKKVVTAWFIGGD
jgi:hypothetical protein